MSPLWRAFTVGFAGLFVGALLWVSGWDEALQEWLWVHYDQSVNTAMRVLGELGKGTAQAGLVAVLGGVAAAVSWVRFRRVGLRTRLFLTTIPVFALASGVNWLFKVAVGRPRPKEILMNGGDPWMPHPFGMDATFWSFPSGHACSTWAIAMWLMLVFPRWRWPLVVSAVVLSASRFLAVTPHYLGDVIAGGALGAAVAMVCYDLYRERQDV